MGLIHMPHKRVLRPVTAFLGRAYTLPYPRTRLSIVARLWGIGGDPPDEKKPRAWRGNKKPPDVCRGFGGGVCVCASRRATKLR